jgi:hypothetical protein
MQFVSLANREFPRQGSENHFSEAHGISRADIVHLTTLEQARAELRSLDTAIHRMFK